MGQELRDRLERIEASLSRLEVHLGLAPTERVATQRELNERCSRALAILSIRPAFQEPPCGLLARLRAWLSAHLIQRGA